MSPTYSQNELAILLLCSNLALEQDKNLKPLTLKEWNSLVRVMQGTEWPEPMCMYDKTSSELIKQYNITPVLAGRIEKLLQRGFQLSIELEKIHNMGLSLIFRSDYPAHFKATLGDKIPPFFYMAGSKENLHRSGIGIVGSRNVDEHGMKFAEEMAKQAVLENLYVISGGARGVDTIAQEAALERGGHVISILHSGLASTIRKKNVRDKIISGQLTLLSAVSPNSRFYAYNAMNRNKYIYGFSKATFVISCDVSKGGTWEGAVENLKNNWVPLFVRLDEQSPKGNVVLVDEYSNHPLMNPFKWEKDISLVKKIQKEIQSKEDKCSGIKSNDKEIHDVYNFLFPLFKKVVKENPTITIEEFAKQLSLEVRQAEIWLKRVLADEHSSKSRVSEDPYQQYTLF